MLSYDFYHGFRVFDFIILRYTKLKIRRHDTKSTYFNDNDLTSNYIEPRHKMHVYLIYNRVVLNM